jgi:hypothetical protein
MPHVHDIDEKAPVTVPGADGQGKPRKRSKKKFTRRQSEQRVLAERARLYDMQEHELRMLQSARHTMLTILKEDPDWDSYDDYNRRWMRGMREQYPFLLEREPVTSDTGSIKNSLVAWAKAEYHKVVTDYEAAYGPLPDHLKLEEA